MPNVKDAMLWNELLIGGLLFPAVHANLQLSLEAVHKANHIFIALEFGIPDEAIDDI